MFTGLSRLRDLLDQAGLEGSYPQKRGRRQKAPSKNQTRRAYDLVAVPSIVFWSPPPIWIRRGFDCSGFATRTSSTPSWYSAFACSSPTPCGSEIEREKLPKRRSKR